MLPHASGPHNSFLGELQDAGEIGAAALPLIVAHSLLSKHGGSLPERLLRIFPRQATLSYAALLLFSSCSISEIDYRRYQWGYHPAPGHPRGCPLLLVSDFRSEKSAERSCRRGFVIGTIFGAWMKRVLYPLSRRGYMIWMFSGGMGYAHVYNGGAAGWGHVLHMYGHFKEWLRG